ncbi:rsbT co-antagonist protein RsbR [Pullulanibacillus pueri]|uniref:Modulator protein RsbR n=1 Tax=Pullulanibacillus pueri TaxID=1437324 RepID=A0A8J2ZZ28_9BACL|nr:STAS domain-containing protein [Pullulanibacillus pueri]MBM7683796.1 rsbT co-antagonist protein RsbR [Pullulanibacillus pueri]GGH87622.1 modulator protein RsbR [Pullulanibacillus pueri]
MEAAPVVTLINKRRSEIVVRWKEYMEERKDSSSIIDGRTIETTNDNFVDLIFDYLADNQSQDRLNNLMGRILALGWPLSYLTNGVHIFRRVVSTLIIESEMEKAVILDYFKAMEDLLDPIFNNLIEDATSTWENTVSIQKRALMELSAPLIPVMEYLAVMPLIGTIDTERAKLIMENLLEGVIAYRTEVVLIDITGVPVVDTMVAHHIIQAAEAVRLVGSECVLVGIRPEIAQTIVNLGIELGEFPTKSTLKKGIEYALELTNRAIVYKDKPSGLRL